MAKPGPKVKLETDRRLMPHFSRRYEDVLTPLDQYNFICTARERGMSWRGISAVMGLSHANAFNRFQSLKERFGVQA
jgi:hypothetical protein